MWEIMNITFGDKFNQFILNKYFTKKVNPLLMLKITTFILFFFFFLHIKLLNFITSVKFKANYKVSCLLNKITLEIQNLQILTEANNIFHLLPNV